MRYVNLLSFPEEKKLNWNSHVARFYFSLQNNDGKLDADDAQIHWQRTKSMLTNKVPDAGGFTAGFLLGARRG